MVYNTLCIASWITSFICYMTAVCVADKGMENHISMENNVEDGSERISMKNNCWMKLNAKQHFRKMDNLDYQYAKVRSNYQKAVERDKFDTQMLKTIIQKGGVAARDVHNTGNANLIPAGINLGGYCMMKMHNSILFFHRAKLRNDTHFRVNYLQNDLENMTLTARLSLNDLHLVGTYERALTDKNPSILYYSPTFGEVEFLLKDVLYKMEGRYRLMKDRLFLELVISDMTIMGGILMTYTNESSCSDTKPLDRENIDVLVGRLKTDLDLWLKDYFNDYLAMFDLSGKNGNQKFQEYDKKKLLALNEYADFALEAIKKRLHKLNSTSVKLPDFTIFSTSSLELKLSNGVLHGLNSMYRCSVATGKKEKSNIRKVDFTVGFNNLKGMYKYEVLLTTGMPPITGLVILNADDMIVQASLSLVKEPEIVDLNVDSIQQRLPESLVLEGPANRVIANFKHLLELHIIALISNTMRYQVMMLSTLGKCHPKLTGRVDPDDLRYYKQFDSENFYYRQPIKSEKQQKYLDDSLELNNPSQGNSDLDDVQESDMPPNRNSYSSQGNSELDDGQKSDNPPNWNSYSSQGNSDLDNGQKSDNPPNRSSYSSQGNSDLDDGQQSDNPPNKNSYVIAREDIIKIKPRPKDGSTKKPLVVQYNEHLQLNV